MTPHYYNHISLYLFKFDLFNLFFKYKQSNAIIIENSNATDYHPSFLAEHEPRCFSGMEKLKILSERNGTISTYRGLLVKKRQKTAQHRLD
jgi:hypothetical protein